MKIKIKGKVFAGLLVCSVVGLAGCSGGEWLPDWDDGRIEIKESPEQEKHIALETISYSDKDYMYIAKEDFVEQFNLASESFVIEEIEELNEANQLNFSLVSKNGGELAEGYYLTAGNNPVQNKMVDVTLSRHEDENTDQKRDRKLFFELVDNVYHGLHGSSQGIEELLDSVGFVGNGSDPLHEYMSFAYGDYDVFAERAKEGLMVAFHTKGTMTYDHQRFSLNG